MVKKLDGAIAALVLAKRRDITLIDARTAEEFEAGHLRYAVNIPYDETETAAPLLVSGKKRLIFVYCSSGFRSGIACAKLDKMGYQNVYDIGKMSAVK